MAGFVVIVRLFFLFSFCASGQNSAGKSATNHARRPLAVITKKPMKNLILIFLIVPCFINCNQKAEITENSKIVLPPPPKVFDKNNLIGFACYYDGEESNPVKLFGELIKSKKYSLIINKLKSETAAEKYLSTIVCKRLEQKKIITLTKSELDQINQNMISQKKVTICSGCTEEDELTIEEMFSDNFLSDDVEEWLSNMIK
ncbi:hypothetical protein G4D82_14185 [Flavobacterium sp. CYK-4]|uniref:hypothetical protein n=1 Tax=Flavobacterium lotistagni TaxID=2709660 RepID=UPI0014079340|nr:hypothetical protein [Flavobacterium lotistagni]NHM08374.1 hypothetical protein [Flavobacterium lotistagni]